MANSEHLKILKQGVDVWNQWREDNPDIRPDLSSVVLINIDLINVDFSGSNLSNADLRNVNFRKANLSNVDLSHTNLSSSNLSDVNLSNADLSLADLSGGALDSVNLIGANLSGADLSRIALNNANFEKSRCGYTLFVDIDFSLAKGLDTIIHVAPSSLGMDTYFKSKGKIPEVFLRGCGVPETLITFLPSMLEEAIQFYSCFISYSHDDKEFARRLHDRLQGQGIRCWLDEHQLKPGDELHKTIYEGIRVYDKVILCCSETALKSWWVEKEFKNAISKEEDYTETVLIPITLDDYVFNQSAEKWVVGEIRRRFVQDFSKWKEHDAFEQAFKKVVDALRTNGSKPPPPASKLTRREVR